MSDLHTPASIAKGFGPGSDPASSSAPAVLDELRRELDGLTTEAIDNSQGDLDGLDTRSLVAAMQAQNRTVLDAVAAVEPLIAAAVDGITERLRRGGRLIYIGAGTSGRLGILDASECPPTFGTDPSLVVGLIAGGDIAIRNAVEFAEDDEQAGAADLANIGLTSSDTVVGISASGRTPYVVSALRFADQTGALTVGVACNAPSRIGAVAAIAIDMVVGPEFLAGSTRLKAGTAQKLVINMLSTLTMVKLGKTFGNVMVDLRVTNAKLQARAEKIIMSLTGVDAARATAALESAGWSTKAAVFAIATGTSPGEAAQSLERHNGRLRDALDAAAGGVES